MSYKKENLDFLQKECQKYIELNDFKKVITIYEEMFSITNNYLYELEIANIHYKIFKNLPKATSIYNKLKPKLEHLPFFWWQYHEIQSNNGNVYEATFCIHKAIELENQVNKEKNA